MGLLELIRKEVNKMGKEPNCFDCQFAHCTPGCYGSYYSPPEPPEAECQHPDMKTEDFDKIELEIMYFEENAIPPEIPDWETIYAKNCGRFMPKDAGPCGNCSTVILEDIYHWDLYEETPMETVPVCSQKCKEELAQKTRQYFTEISIAIQFEQACSLGYPIC